MNNLRGEVARIHVGTDFSRGEKKHAQISDLALHGAFFFPDVRSDECQQNTFGAYNPQTGHQSSWPSPKKSQAALFVLSLQDSKTVNYQTVFLTLS